MAGERAGKPFASKSKDGFFSKYVYAINPLNKKKIPYDRKDQRTGLKLN